MEPTGVQCSDKRWPLLLNHILETNSNSVIINVINFLYNPQPDDARQSPKLLQLINLTAVAIKRLIKMAKKISAFRDMCQEDQVALLKGGCTEMMIMRSVMIYDNDRCAWKVNDICIIYIYIYCVLYKSSCRCRIPKRIWPIYAPIY